MSDTKKPTGRIQDSSNRVGKMRPLKEQRIVDFFSQENSNVLQEQIRQQQNTIKSQEEKITELEALLATAYDELEEKDEVILELYEKYQKLQQTILTKKK